MHDSIANDSACWAPQFILILTNLGNTRHQGSFDYLRKDMHSLLSFIVKGVHTISLLFPQSRYCILVRLRRPLVVSFHLTQFREDDFVGLFCEVATVRISDHQPHPDMLGKAQPWIGTAM